jgi:ADP-heptose:LPS heptosyltransferase
MVGLLEAGWDIVLTGGPSETAALRPAATPRHDGPGIIDLSGKLSLAELAQVLQAAAAVVCGNTGPAHVAAAVGTPVVSLFAPVVPAARWRPFGVPFVLLGEQEIACRGCRARTCPLPEQACISGVSGAAVVAAVELLAGPPCAPSPRTVQTAQTTATVPTRTR